MKTFRQKNYSLGGRRKASVGEGQVGREVTGGEDGGHSSDGEKKKMPT